MNRAQVIKRIQLLEESTKRNKAARLSRLYASMYDWQHRFNSATKTHIACLLMAANQVGKSLTGCVMDATHLTGDYPADWEGHRFDTPPLIWLLGHSGEKTRDLLQHKLFGRMSTHGFEGGMIQADQIVDYKSMQGVTGACREVRVKHKKGISVCQFWSYSQGQHALMGDVVDWYHIDEEPKDQQIYPQVLTRTLNGDNSKGGRGILTLTPENGKTELVCGFMDEPKKGQYMQTATWNEAPHLSDDHKEAILGQYPAYQRAMRSMGSPLMGSGLVFQYSEESISCDRFEIPGHFWIINGMDFGWNHPQAHVQLAIDPDTSCVYVVQGWKKSEKQPFEAWAVVKHWAKNVPTAWPHDGQQHKQQSGNRDAVKQKDMYESEGWLMLDDNATWSDGGNGVGAGLLEFNRLMSLGLFKVFNDLTEVLEEIREYHTKTTPTGISEIVKVKDDLIDAIRYAFMMARFAEQRAYINEPPNDEPLEFRKANNSSGY